MDSPCLAPCQVVAHAPKPLHGFTKQSVIQRPCRFQVCTYMAFLAPIDLQGQFEKKGWCLRSLHGVLCLFIEKPFWIPACGPAAGGKKGGVAALLRFPLDSGQRQQRNHRTIYSTTKRTLRPSCPHPCPKQGTPIHPRLRKTGAFWAVLCKWEEELAPVVY